MIGQIDLDTSGQQVLNTTESTVSTTDAYFFFKDNSFYVLEIV